MDQTNVIVTDPKDDKDEYAQRSRLPKMREDFVKKFLAQGHDKVAFEHLEDLAVDAMSDIALHNYHPLARYNAVLLLSSLHDYNEPTKPYQKTWKVFADCLDSTDPVKVAAMYAILHHVKSGIPPDQQPVIIGRLEKILADKTLAKGESREGHDWIRRRAMDVMLAIGDPAITAKTVATLSAILTDPDASIPLTCSAAKMLGSIRTSALGTVDLSAIAAGIGHVALAATQAELSRAAELAFEAPLPILTPGGGRFGGGRRGNPLGEGGAAADATAAAPTQQFISLRLLKSQLNDLMTAFNGPAGGLVAASANTAHARNVARVLTALVALNAACDNKVSDYETLKAQIEKAADNLDTKLGNAAEPAAAPTPGKKGTAAKSTGKAGAASDAFEDADKAAPAKGIPAPRK